MKEEYSPPQLNVLGELRDVTSSTGAGDGFDLWAGFPWWGDDEPGSS